MTVEAGINALATRVAAEVRKIAPVGPSLTYTAGVLTRIDYANGDYKTLTYTAGQLVQIDHVMPGRTVRKAFTYAAGVLTGITETVI